MRRPLASTLLELAGSLATAGRPGLGVRRLELDLPFECDVVRRAESLDLVGDVPRWRWTTAFDPLLGRLQLVFEEISE